MACTCCANIPAHSSGSFWPSCVLYTSPSDRRISALGIFSATALLVASPLVYAQLETGFYLAADAQHAVENRGAYQSIHSSYFLRSQSTLVYLAPSSSTYSTEHYYMRWANLDMHRPTPL